MIRQRGGLLSLSLPNPVPSESDDPTSPRETVIFGLLLVDDAETKVDLVGLLEVGLHAHDLGKGFLGMLERAETIVEDTDAVP